MFRKAFTVLAIGISIVAIGAVRSQAQDLIVHVHINGYTAKAGYSIWDTADSLGNRAAFVGYNDGKGIGTASLSTMTLATYSSAGCVYKGTMAYQPTKAKWPTYYGFSIAYDAATRTITFSMTSTKNGTVVASDSAPLDAGALTWISP